MQKDEKNEKYLVFAHYLADSARDVTLPYFEQSKPTTVELKSDNSPVTIADKLCEQTLRELIKSNYPSHGILGEEYGEQVSENSLQWVIDPIDGTKSFIDGNPYFGTLIALLCDGEPVVSIVDMPALNQRYSAATNQPCYANVVRTKTSAVTDLAQASIAWTDDTYFLPKELTRAKRVKHAAKHSSVGGDCYIFAQLANGEIDIVVEAGLKPWDYMALILIVQQSGGIITDWQNNPLTMTSFSQCRGQVLAAANHTLHQKALQLIQEKN